MLKATIVCRNDRTRPDRVVCKYGKELRNRTLIPYLLHSISRRAPIPGLGDSTARSCSILCIEFQLAGKLMTAC